MPIETTDRNAEIVAFWLENDWSYQLIAERFGVSRCAVAGIIFRWRHPKENRISSPMSRGGRNKTGTGYQPHSYEPMLTARDCR